MGGALLAYHLIGNLVGRGAWVVLLLAILSFYCIVGSWETLVFLVACALATWVAPLVFARLDAWCKAERSAAKDRTERKAIKVRYAGRKRVVLVCTLLVCFGILACLKYVNVLLYQLSLVSSPTSMGLLLPLGISFYTFQSVSYLIDSYNGKFAPQGNFLKHLLFVSYFPQIIQGPINRYDTLEVQLLEYRAPSSFDVRSALLRYLYGALKKFAIAQVLVTVVDQILSNVTAGTPGSVIVFGILLYSAQQYGDFSGGIDMVEGASELFGIKMSPNFRRPYFSISLADFWRRWHISLGTWMRDYVFFPFALTRPMKALGEWSGKHLGRHAGRTLPACVANILVFFIVGLWHGAEAHYIAWGLYNGIVIALADLLAPVFERMNTALHVDKDSAGRHAFAVIRTFIVVNIGWYFDRIYNFPDSLVALRNTFTNFDAGSFKAGLVAAGVNMATFKFLVFAAVACIVVFSVSLAEERGVNVEKRVLGWNPVARGLVYFLMLALIVVSCFVTQNVSGGFMYVNF